MVMAAPKFRPFVIKTSSSVLNDLKSRLKKTRFADEAEASGWTYGVDLDYMKELVHYWLHHYDWRRQEAYLNSFAQFTANVDDVRIHFVYEKSQKPNAPALVLSHGWPDSFYRFHKVIPLLTKEFDVIVPSIPGFGFSAPRPMGSPAVADLWAKLVTNFLGYESFFAAGGDVGSLITRNLALNHPHLLTGIHLTDAGYPTGQEDPATLSAAEKEFAAFTQQWMATQGAYAMVHINKPHSIAPGLNDSPSGLAAWIVNMINIGADHNAVESAFGSCDELLTNIMIYWITQTAAASIRSYAEEAQAMRTRSEDAPAKSDVPAAIAVYPRGAQFPREWAERSVAVQRYRKMPQGGHFAPLEVPELYAQDVMEACDEIAGTRELSAQAEHPRSSGKPFVNTHSSVH
jgi:pimeloyl-ACP methyl ester carboxylesterase